MRIFHDFKHGIFVTIIDFLHCFCVIHKSPTLVGNQEDNSNMHKSVGGDNLIRGKLRY